MSVLLEIAAFDPASAVEAARSGADRVELCRDAAAGGLTPPLAWVREVTAAVAVPVVVMVRPHARGWTLTDGEHAATLESAVRAVEAGAAGVVWGALAADGGLDADRLREVVEAVAPRPVTVHRAFDAARDGLEALEVARAAGARRILTSGGAPTALEGADRLEALVEAAGPGLVVMPGGGVRSATVAEVVRRTGAREVHSGASRPGTGRVEAAEVRRLRTALDALG